MYQDLDSQAIGKLGVNHVQKIIMKSGHLLQEIDGDVDKGIDGYIRMQKEVKFIRNTKKYKTKIETGNILGVQIKTVSSIPPTGSRSYYINQADKDTFGVNFSTSAKLNKKKQVWSNFIGPVILLFVDLQTEQCWWCDLKDPEIYSKNDYSISLLKKNIFDKKAFSQLKKLGRELFAKNELITIPTNNAHFAKISLTDFKNSAKDAYKNLTESGEFYVPIQNEILGQIKYTDSGWRHITRLNRRKMRIFNSIFLLGVSAQICEKVESFTKVKSGLVRESKRYLKKVDFITLRANVIFNFRQPGIVQVVLRRVKTFDKIHPTSIVHDQIFFHSVYEPYRENK